MVIVDQRNHRGFERVLPEVPGRAPREVVIRQVGQRGHLLHAEVAGMREYAGIEVG